ncbi:hypothetical protein BC940DRAFT_333116 [Gongronella butleri]|nr:hypothetical protein BC940DRAFT_333116 [Gongronella butleri]
MWNPGYVSHGPADPAIIRIMQTRMLALLQGGAPSSRAQLSHFTPTTSLFNKINMPNELDTLRITKRHVKKRRYAAASKLELNSNVEFDNESDTSVDCSRVMQPQVDDIDYAEGDPGSRERDEQNMACHLVWVRVAFTKMHLLVGSSKTETLAVTFGIAQSAQDELAALVQQARGQIQRSALCMAGCTLIDRELVQMVHDALDEGLCCPQQKEGNARKKPNVIKFRRKIPVHLLVKAPVHVGGSKKAISTALCILFA